MLKEQISPLSLIIGYLGIIILLAEGLNRLIKADSEFTRKIVHIGSGNVILLAWWLNIPPSLIIKASLVASIMAIASYFIPILPSINSVGRQSLGTLFYAISIGILTAWFWGLNQPQYVAIGILVMSWGDGMAGLIGQNWGKHPYQLFGNQKSWEGSLTMAVVSFIVTSLILSFSYGNIWQNWLLSLMVAIFATILETFSKLGIDNLTVPVGSAALCFYLQQILA
jgi:phytol kinase